MEFSIDRSKLPTVKTGEQHTDENGVEHQFMHAGNWTFTKAQPTDMSSEFWNQQIHDLIAWYEYLIENNY